MNEYWEWVRDKRILAEREKEKATKPQCPTGDYTCPYYSHMTGCCRLENPKDCDDYLIMTEDEG